MTGFSMQATATATPVSFQNLDRDQLLKVATDLAAEVGRLRGLLNAMEPVVSVGVNGGQP